MHEPLPDHSSLTRIRERYGLEVFRSFFERIVEMCFEAGLVRGDELFFDSTKVEANAAVDSLAPRWAVEAHLGGLFEEDQPHDAMDVHARLPGEPETSDGVASVEFLPTAGDEELAGANAATSDWISRNGRQDRSFKSGYRPRTSDSRASKTDPDASPMTWTRGGGRLGYQTHYVADGGKARIILDVLVTPSEVTENRPMADLLWRTCFRWGIRPHHVTGDSKYGTRENVAALEKAGIRAYVALPNFDFRDTGVYGPGHFRYDADLDAYVCPDGQTLGRRSGGEVLRAKYQAEAEVCNACALKKECTTSQNGRTIYRHRDEGYFDRARSYRGSFPYEKALRKRRVWIEPLFGEGKQWHRMQRFRLRRLEKVNTEALLTASGQNIKRLVRFTGPRPKAPARVVALRPPGDLDRASYRSRRHRMARHLRPTTAFLNRLGRF